MFWRWSLIVSLLALPLLQACGEAPPPERRRPLVDADGDGYASVEFGGRDCNDDDPDINPLSKENTTNGIDDNCNGQIDEFTMQIGHWRLATNDAKQPNSDWHLEIRTNPETGVQYIRCIQFRVRLSSQELNKDTDLTFWLSGLGSTTAKLENNRMVWQYKPEGKAESFTLTLNVTSETTLTGSIVVTDTTPNIKGTATVQLTGRFDPPKASNVDDSNFCSRCYNDSTCGDG